jgi:serine/threonine-protein kinase
VVTSSARRLVTPTALVVAGAVVLAAVVGFVLLPRSVTAPEPAVSGTAAGPEPTAQQRPAPDRAPRPGEPLGQDDLERQVAADRATAESLVDTWVPQLSSRQPGMVIDGVTVDAAAVLADFADLKGQFPDSVLVRSDEYSSFRQAGYWVTVVAKPFASAAEANAWCASVGRGPDDCFAKRLSHTHGPTGSTVHR